MLCGLPCWARWGKRNSGRPAARRPASLDAARATPNLGAHLGRISVQNLTRPSKLCQIPPARPNYGKPLCHKAKPPVTGGFGRWAHLDLNQGPHPYQGCALTGLSYGPDGESECIKREETEVRDRAPP